MDTEYLRSDFDSISDCSYRTLKAKNIERALRLTAFQAHMVHRRRVAGRIGRKSEG